MSDTKLVDLLIEEIRSLKTEVKEVREAIHAVKLKFAVLAALFGVLGGKAGTLVAGVIS